MPPVSVNQLGQNAKGATILAAILGAVIAAGLGVILLTDLGEVLVEASYDLPFRYRRLDVPQDVVLVALDEISHDKLHQSYTEIWNRAFHTKLLQRLTAEHAKAVVFDLVFSDPKDAETDAAFAAAMLTNGTVVLAEDRVLAPTGVMGQVNEYLGRPALLFDESAVSLGLDGIAPDRDQEVRRYWPTIRSSAAARPLSSEAWAAVEVAEPSLSFDTRKDKPFWINYYGPESLYPRVSFYQAIADPSPDVPCGFFSNKVVFVGDHVMTKSPGAFADEFTSPYFSQGPSRFISGTAVHATACLNLLRGDYLRRLDGNTERWIVLTVGLLFGAGLVCLKPLTALLTTAISAVLIVLVDYHCFVHLHYWFPFLIPVFFQIPVAFAWSVVFNSIRLYVRFHALSSQPHSSP